MICDQNAFICWILGFWSKKIQMEALRGDFPHWVQQCFSPSPRWTKDGMGSFGIWIFWYLCVILALKVRIYSFLFFQHTSWRKWGRGHSVGLNPHSGSRQKSSLLSAVFCDQIKYIQNPLHVCVCFAGHWGSVHVHKCTDTQPRRISGLFGCQTAAKVYHRYHTNCSTGVDIQIRLEYSLKCFYKVMKRRHKYKKAFS